MQADMASVLPLSVQAPAILLFGACIGSFLNVLIYRMPRGESVVFPGSHCTSCGREIAWYDNLPIVSWLLLRGRCRTCQASFSGRYPFVELLAALAALALFARWGVSFEFLKAFYLTCALLVVAYIDLDHQIIPDRISLPGIVAGVVLSVLASPLDRLGALGESLLGVLVGGGILLAVAMGYERATGREGMGGGDVKLLAMIGAFLGWKGVLLTLLLASFVGSAIGVAVMISRRADSKLAIPFGPFLSVGALIALFWGDQIITWYLGRLG